MNKVFNTVWCATRGMWVVTSELVRKGGQRPRQIRRTVLAGLIAGLLAPQVPALAASYEGLNLQNRSVTLNNGDMATNITIDSLGHLHISSGGSAVSSVVLAYGNENIFNGGTATATTINKDGRQTVYSGGIATGTVVNSSGGQSVLSGGSAVSAVIKTWGTQSVIGGIATNTIISGGIQNVSSGGQASNTTIDGGYQNVSSGGQASDTIINSGGKQEVRLEGNANNTTINSGGLQRLTQNGRASETVINSGGIQTVDGNGRPNTTEATKTIVQDGGRQEVIRYGLATNTTVNSGGVQFVNSQGSAVNTIIDDGGVQQLGLAQYLQGGGYAFNTTINAGGQQLVERHSHATTTTINSGGNQRVGSIGSAVDTTINAGGMQQITSDGKASNTIIYSDGNQYISSGGSVTVTAINGGMQHVLSGGIASETTINNGGIQELSSGGRVAQTVINEGGSQSVLGGGDADYSIINSGGTLKVDADGTATAITQNEGGAVVTNTSAVLEGTNRNGSFTVTGGSAGNMLLENGGMLEVYDTHEATGTWVDRGGTLLLHSGSVLKGTTTLTGDGTLAGPDVNNQGHLRYLNNSAAVYNGNITGTGDLSVEGGRLTLGGTLSQDGGVFISSGGVLNMDNLQTRGDVTAQSGTSLNLMNGSTLTGRILDDGTGGGDVTVTGPSVWRLTGDSAVGALTLNAGTVDFHGGPTTGLTPVAQAVTLTARTLSGTGTFLMNTDIAAWSGDLLNVTGNASGNFNLGIKNTGQEPASPGKPLRVVHTGSGDAQFTLNGGKVDAGTWEYYLTRENTDWYLSPDIPPEVPPEMKPAVPANRQTTASTDAVLNMASAPVYIFNSELQNLRFRRGDVVSNSPAPGGVWGRYLGSDTRISGAAGSGYTLCQSGFETGGDRVFELGDSRLAVGAFFSFTDNRIINIRGGNSDVESTGGGLYATWADNNGLYVDGVAKFNHFSNTLQTQMSDGTPVRGDYSQNGYGVSLEVGKTFRLNETVWAEPYVLGTAFRADGKDIRLDNGMKARIDTTKSLQAEAGVSVGMNLDVGGTVVKPYLTAAVSHEFADNNNVRINDRYNFRNDISGTTGKYGLGVSAQLTPNAGVWAEARYANGQHAESPVTASVGFRINF
ncbi:autotransporter outer membrane beta-barrel domain-containing protein [Citrobacter amalonaticus]|nr:autotransporter outer membrane beta-barrel domain-containing protein [Citrobacter amalonaticus]RSC59179.1 autotransporter outer membrane beta-barrel domain-containing protein [Citrobacter amalonaticus]